MRCGLCRLSVSTAKKIFFALLVIGFHFFYLSENSQKIFISIILLSYLFLLLSFYFIYLFNLNASIFCYFCNFNYTSFLYHKTNQLHQFGNLFIKSTIWHYLLLHCLKPKNFVKGKWLGSCNMQYLNTVVISPSPLTLNCL